VTLPEPLFLPGTAGPLFALYLPSEQSNHSGVVLLPPFAEEMNLARRMLRLQARALARAGIAALLLDLFGTGDSAGDFADARWDIWVGDVRIAAAALAARGAARIGLLGLRLGAVLAAAAAPTLASPCFATVLWQPVIFGRRYLAEFLRVGTLSGMLRADRSITIDGMCARLAAGEAVEIAGYEIVPPMAEALGALNLPEMAHPALGEVTLFEVVRDPRLPLSAPAMRCASAWAARGLVVTSRSIQGPAFWGGQGNAQAPALIPATAAAFAVAP
jgi:exosortase A-associated hydrolase 2